jgi:hypothetical protein
MFNLELFESVLAVVGVVMLRFVLFLAVVFAMTIPIAIVVKTYEAVGRLVRRVPVTQAVASGGAAKVPR